MTAALALIGLAALAALLLSVAARAGRDMNLEQWAVGGRGFGWIFVFLLLAGEIYTTFTFLGASGFSYGQGAPVYYIPAYGSLAYGQATVKDGVFTNASGMTLYTYHKDSSGKSVCNGPCELSFWRANMALAIRY